jgi:hypothetical protein
MARKRTIYQSEAIFAGPTGTTASVATNNKQLTRVQSANYSFEISRQDVNQFGNLAAIDRIILEQPKVSFDVEYYINTGENESALGLSLGTDTTTPALSGILTSTAASPKDILNYYILTAQEGYDANVSGWQSAGGNVRTIGIGNASVTSYSVKAAVGEIPSVSFNVEGLNMNFINGSGGTAPTVTQSDGASAGVTFALPTPISGLGFSALRPGDIVMSVTGLGVDISDLKIQNSSISLDIGRDPIQKLGSKFAFAREITFPISVKMDAEAIIGDQDNSTYAGLSTFASGDAAFDVSMTLNRPGLSTRALKYTIKKAKLDSQEFSSAIGDNKTIKMSFSTQVGGPNETTAGLFIDTQ